MLLFVTLTGRAQAPVSVSGQVTDAENGLGVPGVNVVVKGQTRGTTTDGNGRYQLSVSDAGAVLVYSSVGYVSQEVTVGNQTSISIRLASDMVRAR